MKGALCPSPKSYIICVRKLTVGEVVEREPWYVSRGVWVANIPKTNAGVSEIEPSDN